MNSQSENLAGEESLYKYLNINLSLRVHNERIEFIKKALRKIVETLTINVEKTM